MNLESKTIKKTDESAKKFIMSLLDGDETHGFDVDSIYFADNKWIVIELLKCDSKFVNPHTSHPNRYPWNWKKFVCLYELSKKLEGVLWLVNYSFKESDKNLVGVLVVESIDYCKLKQYIDNGCVERNLDYLKTKEFKYTLEEFKKVFRDLNRKATLPVII